MTIASWLFLYLGGNKMAFIAKNPIVAPETNSPLVPPQNTRAIFPKDDGWYEIDDKGNVSKLVTDEYGKGLSTNDYTTEEKTKLSELPTRTELDTDLSGKEDSANKVTTLDSNSTDTQYPSAKCVYDADNALVLADERAKYYGDKDIVPSNESYFTVNETGETITGLTDTGKTQTELVIPYKINGKEITNLAPPVNSNNSILGENNDITKVIIIPNSVTSIEGEAFAYCSSLKSINIPISVTSIERNAFASCVLLTSITIPNSVTCIGYSAFYNCASLTSIDIPNSVTSIGGEAFAYCSSLKSINIPNSITHIGEGAFYNCTSLTSINIPNSVTSIGSGTFDCCTSLTSINIPSSVTSIGYEAFGGYTNLTIYCEQGSYAETYAKENNIPVVYTDVKAASINPIVKAAIEEITTVNTIYDLGVQTALTITLPSGQVGDFIQVDFISGSTATTLTVNSSSGLVGFDLIPGTNTIYTLYFDWGETGYDGTVTYGWRFNYSEYSVDVV